MCLCARVNMRVREKERESERPLYCDKLRCVVSNPGLLVLEHCAGLVLFSEHYNIIDIVY